MADHRSRMMMVGDILAAARDGAGDGGGVGVTRLGRGANMPHGRITSVLALLVERGLLEQAGSGGACRYRISGTGREFLKAYREFSSFATDFGLTV